MYVWKCSEGRPTIRLQHTPRPCKVLEAMVLGGEDDQQQSIRYGEGDGVDIEDYWPLVERRGGECGGGDDVQILLSVIPCKHCSRETIFCPSPPPLLLGPLCYGLPDLKSLKPYRGGKWTKPEYEGKSFDGVGESPRGVLTETTRFLKENITLDSVKDLVALESVLRGWDDKVGG